MSYGYLLEHLVLRATELGLGTCWMGYFNPEYFPELARDGVTPAISVVGVPERPRLGERLTRRAVRADKRKDWSVMFFDGTFERPLSREAAGEWAGPLEMLRLAPSAGNGQPWRVVRDGDGTFHLYLHRVKKRYHERGLHDVDIGIAMAHLELAAREAGLSGEWRVEDPGLSAPDGTEYRVSWFTH
ncbi:MAG: hypothetical protein GWN97_00405 [Thermoplasmata archaeon]|nr:hypothetical protein [Thermoplasmata archaeon]NIS10423.1 hypothetical protein [Thermoplasmata archaeon]